MMRREPRLSRQQGFTLVELMVASVLGLVVLGGIVQIFISSKQAYLVHNNTALMQENGRFALHFLQTYLSRTDLGGPATPLILVDNGSAATDEITAKFVVQTGMGGGDEDRTCEGVGYSDGNTIISTFHIANDSFDNLPGLRCSEAVGASGSQELVPNIEHLRIQYGVWSPAAAPGTAGFAGATALGFYDGAAVNAADAGTADLARVYAIRVALIARSPELVRRDIESQSYVLLDQTITKNDKYLRQVYTMTILLPNRMEQ